MAYLVDTNVISELRKGQKSNPGVARWYASVRPADLFVSVLVLGEIRRGVDSLMRRDEERARALAAWLDKLLGNFGARVLPITTEVALSWGTMNAKRSLPVIDSLMAATALAYGLTLVTRNVDDVRGTGAAFLNPFQNR